MKYILFLVISCCVLSVQAQEERIIFYYDSNNVEVLRDKAAFIYELLFLDDTYSTLREYDYNSKNDIISTKEFSDYEKKVQNGIAKTYYPNGKIKSELNYLDNKLHGEIKSYHSNGQLRRQDIYVVGSFSSGKCYTSTGADTAHYLYEEYPQFRGGENALFEYLSGTITYPPKAKRQGIQGKVVLLFVINKLGDVEDIEIKESSNSIFDEEAIRVVNNMPNWIPGKIDGEAINVQYNLPLRFVLNN